MEDWRRDNLPVPGAIFECHLDKIEAQNQKGD
jgi:hypothetical protein